MSSGAGAPRLPDDPARSPAHRERLGRRLTVRNAAALSGRMPRRAHRFLSQVSPSPVRRARRFLRPVRPHASACRVGRGLGSLGSRGAKAWRPRRGRGSPEKRRGRALNPKNRRSRHNVRTLTITAIGEFLGRRDGEGSHIVCVWNRRAGARNRRNRPAKRSGDSPEICDQEIQSLNFLIR